MTCIEEGEPLKAKNVAAMLTCPGRQCMHNTIKTAVRANVRGHRSFNMWAWVGGTLRGLMCSVYGPHTSEQFQVCRGFRFETDRPGE